MGKLQPPRPEVTRFVKNHSSRGGVGIGMIVIHTTEGSNIPRSIRDLEGLGSFFDGSVQASSHIANDSDGHDARYVRDEDKAWTCANANPFTLNIEQIGFARTSRKEWYKQHHKQLKNTARWIAYWSRIHSIPIQRGVAPFGVLLRKGVASHKQLGLAGGGHWDPGPSYPMNYVLWLARYYKQLELGITDKKLFDRAKRQVNKRRNHYGIKEKA